MSKAKRKPHNRKVRRKSFMRLPSTEYLTYINSDAWRAVRERYFASKLPQNCLVCNSVKVDLHHRTYKRLGYEWLADLMPLCRKHHTECHAFISAKNRPLTAGTNRYLTVKNARWHGGNGKNPKFKVKTKH